MTHYVNKLWKKGLRLGYQEDLPILDKNRVKSVNALAIVMLLVTIGFLVILLATGMSIWYYMLPGLPFYCVGLLLNRSKRYDLARYFLFFGSLLLITFWAFTNRRVGAEFGLMAVACSAPLTFKEKTAVYLSFLFTVVVFFIYKYYDAVQPFLPNPSVNYPVLSMMALSASGVVIFFQLMTFRDLVHHYSETLKKINKELMAVLDSRQVVQEELKLKHDEQRKLTEQLNWIVKQKTSELQTYLDAINVNIYSSINDRNGNFIKVNDPLTSATGYSSEELMGKHFRTLDSGYQAESFYQEMEVTMLSGKTWRGEVKNKTKNGSIYWTDQVILPIKGKDDKVNYFLMLALPITERKLNEEAREKTVQVLENIAFRTSHKIRGPLARIQGLVGLVQKDLVRAEEIKSIATNLEACSFELNMATTDLVQFVNEHQNSIQREPTAVQESYIH
jgi:PAS domain S-box-containing protein